MTNLNEAAQADCDSFVSQIDIGLMVGNTQVIFEKAENSSLTLVGMFLLCLLRHLIKRISPQNPDVDRLRAGKSLNCGGK